MRTTATSRLVLIAMTSFIVSGVTIGCNKLAQNPVRLPDLQTGTDPDGGGVYPHSAEFKLTKMHGTRYLSDGQACKTCHNVNPVNDLSGRSAPAPGSAQNAPACVSCHKVFPHSQEFKTSKHGSHYFEDRTLCMQCHGKDYQGGNIKIACQKCHDYPHVSVSAAWALPTQHGKNFVDSNSTVNCLACHGETSTFKQKHPDRFVSCGSCHVAVPHSEEFKSGAAHASVARTYEGKCTGCHKNLVDHMPNMGGAGCYACHDENTYPGTDWKHKVGQEIYPHTEAFKTTNAHGTAYFKSRALCKECHGKNFEGGAQASACSKCHAYPHEGKWALPTQHGTKYLEGQTITCLNCHGENNSLKNRHPEHFVSCGSCHTIMPHEAGFDWKHYPLARTYAGKCTQCHTDQMRLLPSKYDTDGDGKGEGCYYCHTNPNAVPRVKWRNKQEDKNPPSSSVETKRAFASTPRKKIQKSQKP